MLTQAVADAFLLIGIGITVFSILLLADKRSADRANRVALAMLIFNCVRFIGVLMRSSVHWHGIPVYLFFNINLFFLDGVLLFWFTKAIGNEPFLWRRQAWHLIPVVMVISMSIVVLMTNDIDQLNTLFQATLLKLKANTYDSPLMESALILAIVGHNAVYIYLSRKALHQYRQKIKATFSNIDKIRMQWLDKMIQAWIVLLWLPLLLLSVAYVDSMHILPYFALRNMFVISLVIMTSYFAFHVNRQQYVMIEPVKGADSVEEKYKTSGMGAEERKKIFCQLQTFMQENRPFLEPELSLGDLATASGIKYHILSQVINTETKGNFYDFINEYRVEEVSRALLETNDPVMVIAYRTGFNSKSTFNAVFKKTTGKTPSQLRKEKRPTKSSELINQDF